MVGVVAADPDHLAARDDRREQPHVVDSCTGPGGLDPLVERVARDLGDLLARAVDQTVCRVVARREPRDAHGPSLRSRERAAPRPCPARLRGEPRRCPPSRRTRCRWRGCRPAGTSRSTRRSSRRWWDRPTQGRNGDWRGDGAVEGRRDVGDVGADRGGRAGDDRVERGLQRDRLLGEHLAGRTREVGGEERVVVVRDDDVGLGAAACSCASTCGSSRWTSPRPCWMQSRSMPSGLRLTQRCTSLAPMSMVTSRVVRLWACRNSTAWASWCPRRTRSDLRHHGHDGLAAAGDVDQLGLGGGVHRVEHATDVAAGLVVTLAGLVAGSQGVTHGEVPAHGVQDGPGAAGACADAPGADRPPRARTATTTAHRRGAYPCSRSRGCAAATAELGGRRSPAPRWSVTPALAALASTRDTWPRPRR